MGNYATFTVNILSIQLNQLSTLAGFFFFFYICNMFLGLIKVIYMYSRTSENYRKEQVIKSAYNPSAQR